MKGKVSILAQPDDRTCGPTCLHALYGYYGDDLPLERVIAEVGDLVSGGTLAATMRQGGAAMVADRDYLDTLGRGGGECTAQDLWRHLIARHEQSVGHADMVWAPALNLFGHQGCLAQRIRDAAGHDCSRRRLHLIYAHLCDCLHEGEPFGGLPAAGDL
jgi:hypothetical protein